MPACLCCCLAARLRSRPPIHLRVPTDTHPAALAPRDRAGWCGRRLSACPTTLRAGNGPGCLRRLGSSPPHSRPGGSRPPSPGPSRAGSACWRSTRKLPMLFVRCVMIRPPHKERLGRALGPSHSTQSVTILPAPLGRPKVAGAGRFSGTGFGFSATGVRHRHFLADCVSFELRLPDASVAWRLAAAFLDRLKTSVTKAGPAARSGWELFGLRILGQTPASVAGR